MNSISKQLFLTLGILLVSPAQGMEKEITWKRTSIDDTVSMWVVLDEIFPREIKWYIISLFLESELSYNFECSNTLKIGYFAIKAFNPDRTSVVTNNLEVCSIKTGKKITELKGHPSLINSVVFSPDGNKILTGSTAGLAGLWDAQTGIQLQELRYPSSLYSVAFSPSGSAIMTGSENSIACMWDLSTGKELQKLKNSNGVYSIAYR
nr:hypothetical protein [Candidatus Dependentiae bacterium]